MSEKESQENVLAQSKENKLLYDLKQCCVLLDNLNTNDLDLSSDNMNLTPRKSIRSRNKPYKYEDFVDSSSPSRSKKKQAGSDEELCSTASSDNSTSKTKMEIDPYYNKRMPDTTLSTTRKKTRQNSALTTPIQTPQKKVIEDTQSDCQESDFSDSGSDFVPETSDDSNDSETSSSENEENDSCDEDFPVSLKQLELLKKDCLKSTPAPSPGHVLTPDNYFLINSGKKNSTSVQTLGKVKQLTISHIDHENIQESEEHRDKIKDLNKSYKRLYSWWFSDLMEGFNLIFYGHGSKRNLLNNFAQKMLSDYPCVIVNGFFPSLNIRSILEGIIVDTLECSHVSSDISETMDLIEMELEEHNAHLFLIIHNIDGPMLRNAKCQDMLSNLAQIKRLHLLASIDHINASLLWNESHLSKLKFRWCESSTYIPYSVETSYESRLARAGGGGRLASLRSVYRSLTANAKGIFKIIVEHRLDNQKAHYQGIPFKELYSKSREKFVASSDTALRTQLTEFLDHKIVKMKRTVDGSENVVLLLDTTVIQQFLAEQD